MFKFPCILPKLWLRVNGTKFGKGLKLIGYPFIFRYPKAAITIGENVRINSNFFSNLIGLYQRTIIIARGEGKIELGKNVGISGSTIYARDSVTIGDNTLIGANTKIFDNDFHHTDPTMRENESTEPLMTKPVSIGKNVFIGCNVIILKGTTIGDNCTVGAGSVVSGNFPKGVVIAGNPARVVKEVNK